MIVPDANVLLYAYNASASEHAQAMKWWEDALNGHESVGLGWQVITAFLRISTNPRAFPFPYTPKQALAIVEEWLEQPACQIISPGGRHMSILRGLILSGQASGPLVMDAHLAALALEHGAILCSTDKDFSRFEKVKIFNPCA